MREVRAGGEGPQALLVEGLALAAGVTGSPKDEGKGTRWNLTLVPPLPKGEGDRG